MEMKRFAAEILCVGTELLLGDIVNTNAAFLSRELSEIGICVYHQTVVGDNPKRLSEAFLQAWDRSDIVITSGGLGPTYDDLTKQTICCDCLGRKLAVDEPSLAEIKMFFEKRGRKMTENNVKQAMIPEGGRALRNPRGTAPGVYLEQDGKRLFMLPGPPRELEPLFLECVKPDLQTLSGQVFVSDTLSVYGIGESALEARLLDLMEQGKNPTLAPYAKDGEVQLRVTACAESEEAAREMNGALIARVRERIGEYIYGINVKNLESVLVEKLLKTGTTLSVAESCTGGLLSKRLTDVSGVSAVYRGGICSYDNGVKADVLGVLPETLEKYGAVSTQTADEMACGVAALLKTELALSVTGIAGPGGGSEEKPVGTVCFGVFYRGRVYTERMQFGEKSTRDYIRTLASSKALSLAIAALSEQF